MVGARPGNERGTSEFLTPVYTRGKTMLNQTELADWLREERLNEISEGSK